MLSDAIEERQEAKCTLPHVIGFFSLIALVVICGSTLMREHYVCLESGF